MQLWIGPNKWSCSIYFIIRLAYSVIMYYIPNIIAFSHSTVFLLWRREGVRSNKLPSKASDWTGSTDSLGFRAISESIGVGGGFEIHRGNWQGFGIQGGIQWGFWAERLVWREFGLVGQTWSNFITGDWVQKSAAGIGAFLGNHIWSSWVDKGVAPNAYV